MQGPSALEILLQRYARGEVDATTYQQMREQLHPSPGPLTAVGEYKGPGNIYG